MFTTTSTNIFLNKPHWLLVFLWALTSCASLPSKYNKCWALAKQQGKTGLINSKGAWVMPPTFDDLKVVNHQVVLASNKTHHWYLSNTYLLSIKGDTLHRFPDSLNVQTLGSNHLLAAQVIAQHKIKKTGLCNARGVWITLPKYTQINNFSERLAAVKYQNKWGFINEHGEEIIANIYNQVSPFLNGLAIAQKDTLYGLIDTKGRWALAPQYNALSKHRVQGLLAAKHQNKWGVINEKGRWVMPAKYEFVQLLGANRALAWQRMRPHSRFRSMQAPRQLLLVSIPKGNVVKKLPQNSFIFQFNQGHALLISQMSLDWQRMNQSIAQKNCLPFRLSTTTEETGKKSFIDTTGKVMIALDWGEVTDFDEGLARKKINQPIKTVQGTATEEKWIFIDQQGKQAINSNFIQAAAFHQGQAIVQVWVVTRQQALWGIINKKGKWVIPPRFEELSNFKCF